MSLSLLISNVKVTGSNIIYNADLTGIGGAQVFVSGSKIFISGGAGGTAGTGAGITQNQLDSLSGFTTGLSGFLSARDIAISGVLQAQISSSSAGVSNINGASGALTLIGGGGILINLSGQNIFITGKNLATSGDITGLSGWVNSNFATISNVTQTGVQIINIINLLSGYTTGLVNSTSGILQSQITIANSGVSNINGLSGAITLVGKGNIAVSVQNQNINISGISGPTLPFIFNTYNFGSGEQSNQFIPFNYNFPTIPNVIGNIVNNSGDLIIAYYISGINTSGFYLNFSDTLNTSNYSYQYYATTGTGYFSLGGTTNNTSSSTYSPKIVTNNYSINIADDVIVFNSPTNVTGILPSAIGGGKFYIVKNINVGTLLITGNNVDTIDGQLTQTISQWNKMSFLDYSINKWIII